MTELEPNIKSIVYAPSCCSYVLILLNSMK